MKITVVIPVLNEEHSIEELLDRLLEQTRQPDEIIVTDGGSTDSTVKILERYEMQGAHVKIIRAGFALPGRGRNLAAAAATSDWIAFIDAGTRPDRSWLKSLSFRAEQDQTIDVVYGSWEPVIDSFFQECAAIAYVPPAIPVNGFHLRPRSIISALMRREVWRSVGGFPEKLRSAEDLIFMNRVEQAGLKIVFEPRALVRWNIQKTFSSTFKRFVVYSRNNVRAGLWREWQAAILSRYLILLILALPVLIFGRRWFWVPIGLWLGMLVARGVLAINRNQMCYPAGLRRNLHRLIVLTPLLALLDAAALTGAAIWLLKDRFDRGRNLFAEAADGG